MSVAVLGEALIDLIAGDDGAYRPHLGGSPFNVAIGLARQGIDVSYLAPLSDDAFGDRLAATLEREGVKLPITRRSRHPTSLAIVTIDASGLPSYRLYREGIADKDVTFDEIAAVLPDGIDIFHTGSLAITPSQVPKIHRLIDLLRERGVLVSMDINIRLRASVETQAYLAGVRSLMPRADIVKASDEDLEALGLSADPQEAVALAFETMEDGVLIHTVGKGGATLLTRAHVIVKSAYPVADLQDTVGAGDTFHSAFLAALIRSGRLAEGLERISREALDEALDFASAAAAINVSRVGCSPPTQREVQAFIDATHR